MSSLANETVIPNIYWRMLTKEAYSWLSLVFILVSVCAYQLAVAFGPHPPLTFIQYFLGVVVLIFIGSFVFTHRFWRFDR